MNVQSHFESELVRRGIEFTVDADSGRHAIDIDGTSLLVSLDNLQRDFSRDGDLGRIPRFVDTILESTQQFEKTLSPDQLYWCLERNDFEVAADFRTAISDQVDRVLVHLSSDGKLVTWMTPPMLSDLGLSEADAGTAAFNNLAIALDKASIESEDVDGVALGFITTELRFKSSLILAPNLREKVEAFLGWPLLSVAPDRDFLYLWSAAHSDFAGRVGHVVVREYLSSSYPISTEVYKISDAEIIAIGAFPV